MQDEPIEFHCGACGKLLKVTAHGAGKTVVCPGCGQSIIVPETPQPTELPQIVLRPEIRAATYKGSLPASRSYPALTLIALICRILAVVVAAVAVLAIMAVILLADSLRSVDDQIEGRMPWLSMAMTVGPIGIGAVLVVLALVMTAESIKLGIDIQANTLATAHASRRPASGSR
jgi:DNA-directed RNA polymerase subunit RPC12/RpoP